MCACVRACACVCVCVYFCLVCCVCLVLKRWILKNGMVPPFLFFIIINLFGVARGVHVHLKPTAMCGDVVAGGGGGGRTKPRIAKRLRTAPRWSRVTLAYERRLMRRDARKCPSCADLDLYPGAFFPVCNSGDSLKLFADSFRAENKLNEIVIQTTKKDRSSRDYTTKQKRQTYPCRRKKGRSLIWISFLLRVHLLVSAAQLRSSVVPRTFNPHSWVTWKNPLCSGPWFDLIWFILLEERREPYTRLGVKQCMLRLNACVCVCVCVCVHACWSTGDGTPRRAES